ncbi:MAG: SRPBCC family protein [Acidimicrobiia bacterium]
MSVQMDAVVIDRPIEEVFGYFVNFENSPTYGRSEVSVKATEGPITVGTIFDEESRIMGRTMKHQSQITELAPPTAMAYTNTFVNGMTEQARFTFTGVEGGTSMVGSADVQMPKAPQLLAGFFTKQMTKQVTRLLEDFKETVEST